MTEPVSEVPDIPPAAVQARTEVFAVQYQTFVQVTPNGLRFKGKGTAQVRDGALYLTGLRSRPLWFSKYTETRIALERILDVRVDGRALAFKIDPEPAGTRRPRLPMTLFLDKEQAQLLAAALPARVSEQALELAAFEAKFGTGLSGAPATIALLAVNIAAYLAFAMTGGGIMNADGEALIRWGSNFGPLTSDGQWWRLATATFLHGGLIHLLVNMATLFDVGSLCERIYGTRRYLVLYALSGLAGSAASLWWHPTVNSVGASGALFGVLGATFGFMLDKRNGVPVSVMNAHAASMGVFIAYGLFNGMSKEGIDNAAHVGGLVAGLIAGFALAAPIGGKAGPSALRAGAGVAICIAAILALFFLTPNMRAGFELEKRFSADLRWFEQEEGRLIGATRSVIERGRMPLPPRALLQQEMVGIVSGWQQVHSRMGGYQLPPESRRYPLQQDLVELAEVRLRGAKVLARAVENPFGRRSDADEFARLRREGDDIIARMKERMDRNAKEAKKK